MKVFTLGCVVTSAGQINQIQESSVDTGIEEYLAIGDGKVDPDYVAALLVAPKITFRTTAVSRALGYCGLGGLAVSTAADFYFRQFAAAGTREAAKSVKVTLGYGLIVPTILEADQRSASITYEAIARSNDGTTAPLATTVNQSMPALTAADQLFVAGPANINGTAVDSVVSTRVEFNYDIVSVASDGSAYPGFVAIRKRPASITLTSYDLELLNVLGTPGAAQGATDSLVYLRKCAQNGTRVAAATAEHIKISIDDGRVSVRRISASEDGEGQAEIRITPTWDGTNDLLAISPAAAIT